MEHLKHKCVRLGGLTFLCTACSRALMAEFDQLVRFVSVSEWDCFGSIEIKSC